MKDEDGNHNPERTEVTDAEKPNEDTSNSSVGEEAHSLAPDPKSGKWNPEIKLKKSGENDTSATEGTYRSNLKSIE